MREIQIYTSLYIRLQL